MFLVILIGDSNVGKTSFLTRFTNQAFHIYLFLRLTKNVMPKKQNTTIGVEYATKLIPLTNGEGNVKA